MAKPTKITEIQFIYCRSTGQQGFQRLAQTGKAPFLQDLRKDGRFWEQPLIVNRHGRMGEKWQTLLPAQEIETRLDLSPDLPHPYLVTDQIQQVIFNIIINSIDAMPSGGELFLKTSQEGENLQLLIEDSGPGIPEEERTRIFEPFVSKKEGGIGLGLPISAGIISAQGGQIELVPSDGRGAIFRILLPVGDRR